MKQLPLIFSAGLVVAASAHAQYATTSVPANTAVHSKWEADAGLGYVFGASPSVLDNGVNAHVAAYYKATSNVTQETSMKVGVEFLHSTLDLDVPGNNSFDSNFMMVNGGLSYRLSKTFEAGVIAGVGVGRHGVDVGAASDSTNAFGFQIRPELTAYLNDSVGISLGYRYFRSSFLDNDFKTGFGSSSAAQHSLELGVKVRF